MKFPIGEVHLTTLLATMKPRLEPTVFVFASAAAEVWETLAVRSRCQFYEAEGVTLILEQAEADRLQLPYQYPCRLITLTVHSSLAAVGLLAAVTTSLAAANISANVVSAYFHDHIFVPCDRAEEALACLEALSAQARIEEQNAQDAAESE